MKNMQSVHLHPYKHDRHDLIKVLKRNGELREIIERAILLERGRATALSLPDIMTLDEGTPKNR